MFWSWGSRAAGGGAETTPSPCQASLALPPSKVFLTVTRLYFSAKDSGERSVCLTFAFVFLLLAMLVQVVREETLELGLEPGRCGPHCPRHSHELTGAGVHLAQRRLEGPAGSTSDHRRP